MDQLGLPPKLPNWQRTGRCSTIQCRSPVLGQYGTGAPSRREVVSSGSKRWLDATVERWVPRSRYIPARVRRVDRWPKSAYVLEVVSRKPVEWQRRGGHPIPVPLTSPTVQLRFDCFADKRGFPSGPCQRPGSLLWKWSQSRAVRARNSGPVARPSRRSDNGVAATTRAQPATQCVIPASLRYRSSQTSAIVLACWPSFPPSTSMGGLLILAPQWRT